jgi:glycerophosphoryl diester phosphodiesterase
MFKIFWLCIFSFIFFSCAQTKKMSKEVNSFDFQAHRGGRGDMPENTMQSMLYAASIPYIKTLELDVVISKDKKVILSHDQVLNHQITTKPNGEEVKLNEPIYLYQLNYDSIIKYDVGLKYLQNFPNQKKIAATIPLLSEVIDVVEKESNRKMWYNIEIKSNPKMDGLATPEIEEFVTLVTDIILSKGIKDRVIIQSFDVRPLRLLHQKDSTWQLSFLLDKGAEDLDKSITYLGFTPTVYSPAYGNVSKNLVDKCHAKNMKIVPWTVNKLKDIQALYNLGVDGIISDYPLLFKSIK